MTQLNVQSALPLVSPLASPIADGLVLYLPCQEGSGRITQDFSTGRKNATLQSGVVWNAAIGAKGAAVQCGGASDEYLVGSDSQLPSGGSDRTIMLWMRITGLYNYQVFFFYGTELANKGISFSTSSTTQISDGPSRLLLGIYGQNAPSSDLRITARQWYHVGVTLKGQTAEYFINGVPAGGGYILTAPDTVLDQYRLAKGWIGQSNLRGQIRNLRVYNRILAANEFRRVYEMES